MRSSALVRVCVAALLLGTLSACGGGVKGRWVGSDVKPEMARDQFRFLVPANHVGRFVSADVRLQKDGTFNSSVVYDKEVTTVSGTWEFRDDVLTFRDEVGNSWIYGVRKDGDELDLVQGIKGTDVSIKMEKSD
jgi:hypothetical protein